MNQTYKNIEIICVDDGSTDRSGEIADEYARNDSRIIVVHKENGGLVSARKTGTQLAKGLYIANVDSDDWIEPDMFKEIISIALQYKADIVTTQEIRDYGDYVIKSKLLIDKGVYTGEKLVGLKERIIDQDSFYKCNISGHVCDKIFIAEKYKEVQAMVPNEISKGEDTVVAFPLLFDSKTVYVSDKHYYHYCLRHDSIMGRDSSTQSDELSMYKSHVVEVFGKYGKDVRTALEQARLLILYYILFNNLAMVIRYDKASGNLNPYGIVRNDEKVAIYGSGKYGAKLYDFISKSGWFGELGWYDTEGKNGAQKVDEHILEYDKIIIGAIQGDAVASIKKELIRFGIDDSKVLLIKIQDSKLVGVDEGSISTLEV